MQLPGRCVKRRDLDHRLRKHSPSRCARAAGTASGAPTLGARPPFRDIESSVADREMLSVDSPPPQERHRARPPFAEEPNDRTLGEGGES